MEGDSITVSGLYSCCTGFQICLEILGCNLLVVRKLVVKKEQASLTLPIYLFNGSTEKDFHPERLFVFKFLSTFLIFLSTPSRPRFFLKISIVT